MGTRREMLATRAVDNQTTIAYANLVGANDGLVFDGGGIVNQNGRPVLDSARFREGFEAVTVDLDRTTRCRREASTWRTDLEAYRSAGPTVPSIRIETKSRDRSRLRYPAPPAGSTFFLPSDAAPTRSARDALLDDL